MNKVEEALNKAEATKAINISLEGFPVPEEAKPQITTLLEAVAGKKSVAIMVEYDRDLELSHGTGVCVNAAILKVQPSFALLAGEYSINNPKALTRGIVSLRTKSPRKAVYLLNSESMDLRSPYMFVCFNVLQRLSGLNPIQCRDILVNIVLHRQFNIMNTGGIAMLDEVLDSFPPEGYVSFKNIAGRCGRRFSGALNLMVKHDVIDKYLALLRSQEIIDDAPLVGKYLKRSGRGTGIYFRRDFAEFIISLIKKQEKAPEGWLTTRVISDRYNVPYRTMREYLKRAARSLARGGSGRKLTDYKRTYTDARGIKDAIVHYNDEVVQHALKTLKEERKAPPENTMTALEITAEFNALHNARIDPETTERIIERICRERKTDVSIGTYFNYNTFSNYYDQNIRNLVQEKLLALIEARDKARNMVTAPSICEEINKAQEAAGLPGISIRIVLKAIKELTLTDSKLMAPTTYGNKAVLYYTDGARQAVLEALKPFLALTYPEEGYFSPTGLQSEIARVCDMQGIKFSRYTFEKTVAKVKAEFEGTTSTKPFRSVVSGGKIDCFVPQFVDRVKALYFAA